MTIAQQETLWDGIEIVGKFVDRIIFVLEKYPDTAQRDQVEAIYLFYVEFERLGKVLADTIEQGDPEIFHEWFLHATKPETIRRELQFVQNELRPDLLPDDVREERKKKQAAVRAMRRAAKSKAR